MNLRSLLLVIACSFVFILQLGGSCSSSGGGHSGGGYHAPPPEPYPPSYPPAGYPPPGYDDGRPNRVPNGADMVYEGMDRLRWDADQDGTVYVYSIGDNRIPWTGPIRRGQQIVIRPKDDCIDIDGRTVYRGNLERNSPHQIYITRPGGWGGGGGGGRPPGGGWAGGGGGGGSDGGGGGGGNNPNRPSSIPREARFMYETEGRVNWNAPADGNVWVFSVKDNRIPYSGRMRKGDELVVQPRDSKIFVAGRQVYAGNLVNDGRHQVYFDAGAGPGEGGGNAGGGGWGGSGGDLPRGAKEVASGRGDLAINQAARDGQIFVFDVQDRRVIYSTGINKGNSFQMFPGQNFVNLNSKRHADVQLPRGRQYALYFRER